MALRLTRPTPACRDTPLRGSAAARSATRRIVRFTTCRIMHVKFVNGRETVSAQCLETFADASESVSWQCPVSRQFRRANRIHFTRPPRACRDRLFSHGRTTSL